MKIILASQSPRRRELLSHMSIPFEVVIREVDEHFPKGLGPIGAVRHIAEKKALIFKEEVADELVIAADTIVTVDGQVLGKPKDGAEAIGMLSRLAGGKHEVITAVALLHNRHIHTFHEVTEVYLRKLSEWEINHYIRHYRPFDKAGGYGIQEWIGLVAIEKIVGSYTNVVGLPTQRLYQILKTSYPGALPM